MSRRQERVKFNSDAVQGKGSWVKVSKLRLKEMRNIDRDLKKKGNINHSLALIKDHVVEWNWADENGDQLPIPSESPEVLDDLTGDEFKFLCECIAGSTEIKN